MRLKYVDSEICSSYNSIGNCKRRYETDRMSTFENIDIDYRPYLTDFVSISYRFFKKRYRPTSTVSYKLALQNRFSEQVSASDEIRVGQMGKCKQARQLYI
jgi:hypothetical protein